MNPEAYLSCDDFVLPKSSSSILAGHEPDPRRKELEQRKEQKCTPEQVRIPSSSSSSTMWSGVRSQDFCAHKEPIMKTPNIGYEVAVAKSIMQQFSSISGDNLFDHISDIIKRVIDERPPNVIDFFEEFSRNVREQNFHLPERFPPSAVFEESRMFKVAKQQLESMKLPYPSDTIIHLAAEDLEEEHAKSEQLKLNLKEEQLIKFNIFHERVQHLQFFWNQCGFSISSEDIFQLACSMNRLQTHPAIRCCRFWGIINGLKASYYIVEASLSPEEYESRYQQMEKEMIDSLRLQDTDSLITKKQYSHIGPELTPGAVGWENYPEKELYKMQASAFKLVPVVKVVEVFDVPPEPVGRGVNRFSYFVVNSLSDEWIELPIVTPRQIILSRQIKKFFTGDLESDICSNPYFCGKEKHYLRAMISRITAGSYIAPRNYYRKMTKKETALYEGYPEDELEAEEEEEEEEEPPVGEGEEEDKEADNDLVLLINEKYDSSLPLSSLSNTDKWVHIRPNILLQGRVLWFNEAKAEREREKERKRLEKERRLKEMGEEDSEEDGEEEEESEAEEEAEEIPETGPAILTPCSRDTNTETSKPWASSFTSKFTNENERILIMKSNVWPGACTFVYKDLCESIYLGWGHKYVARNMPWAHMDPIANEYAHKPEDFIESNDPTVQDEELYQLSLMKKQRKFVSGDDMGEYEGLEATDEENDNDND